MATRAGLLACATGAVFVAGLGVAAYAQRTLRDVPSAVTIVTRERLEGASSLLMDLPGRRLDQLIAQLPTSTALVGGHVPPGWSVNQKGREIRLSGPAADGVSVRLDGAPGALNDYAGKEVRIRAGLGGQLSDWERAEIRSLPRVNRTANLEGILTVPPQGTPGSPLMIGVSNDYRRGTWALNGNGSAVPLVSPDSLTSIEVIRGVFPAQYGDAVSGVVAVLTKRTPPQPFVTVFPPSGLSRATYTDPFGELIVDAPLSISSMPGSACPLSIHGGSALTFAGQSACVSGCFPNVESVFGLRMDGQTELAPWGMSPTTVMLGIPADTTPGVHTVSVPGSATSITIGVITMEGSLDQTKLWRGESTTMRLRVVGTTEPFPLTVLNRTPGIIELEGGAYQVLTTPGGADNAITRNVRGIQRGDFAIVYSVNSPGCGVPRGM
jgi:hypothetical protein